MNYSTQPDVLSSSAHTYGLQRGVHCQVAVPPTLGAPLTTASACPSGPAGDGADTSGPPHAHPGAPPDRHVHAREVSWGSQERGFDVLLLTFLFLSFLLSSFLCFSFLYTLPLSFISPHIATSFFLHSQFLIKMYSFIIHI